MTDHDARATLTMDRMRALGDLLVAQMQEHELDEPDCPGRRDDQPGPACVYEAANTLAYLAWRLGCVAGDYIDDPPGAEFFTALYARLNDYNAAALNADTNGRAT